MAVELPHILVVDDDKRLRELLRRFLTENDFRVTTAGDAAAAQAHMVAFAFDLIVLDVMMPGRSGLDLTDDLRRDNDVPILLLTAMGTAEDRIAGLERGADDYLTKPFEPRELLARIRSILRRAPSTRHLVDDAIRLGTHSYDIMREELSGPGGPVRLTRAEQRLLRALAARPGVTISREELTHASELAGNVRAVDVQVTRLRRKIESDPKVPRYLQTVRGEGYVLRPD